MYIHERLIKQVRDLYGKVPFEVCNVVFIFRVYHYFILLALLCRFLFTPNQLSFIVFLECL